MKKYIYLFIIMILFIPNCVLAKEIDAIEQINDYKLDRDTNLIESTNNLASVPITIETEEINAEDRLNIKNLGYALLILPVIGSLAMYTFIIKAE